MTSNAVFPSRAASADRFTPDALPFIVGLGTMFLAGHVSGMTTVFPRIIGELGVSVSDGQWILTAYTLSLSVCLLAFGVLADRIGLLRVYVWGMAIFGISSGACAAASGVWALVALRSAQGVGAAMVAATSVALIGASIAQKRLGRAVGWQTGMTYAGLALGPIVAGYAVQRFGWRILFAMNVPAAALAILAAAKAPEQETSLRRKPLFGGWMFRTRGFIGAAASEVVFYLCLYAIGFLLPLHLSQDRGFTTAQTGVLLGLQGGARALAAPVSGRMADLFGAVALVRLGIVFLMLAAWLLYSFSGQTSPGALWGALIALGIGSGLFAPANSKVLLCASPRDRYGISTGVLGTARSVGMTLGVAVATLLYSGFGGGGNRIDGLAAVRNAFAVVSLIALLYAAAVTIINTEAPARQLTEQFE